MSDLELLQQYTRTQSQDAFTALVQRHVHLVYSAARRQVRSPQLAEEVAQSVFIDLARGAAKLAPEQPLVAWLFLVTRRTAIDVIRREARRQDREQTAAALSAEMETPSPSWNQMKDVLDDAIASLEAADRTALLLRFFENRTLREVGATLGTSEDTAQKRVSRALDRLRALLAQRGIAVASATLATDLSAHAIETAPAALSATISTTALTSAPAFTAAPATLASSHAAGSAALQKTLAAAATLAVLGVVAFEAQAIVHHREELATLSERSTTLRTTLAQIRTAHAADLVRLQSARVELARTTQARVGGDPELEAAAEAWLERVKRLKEIAANRSDLRIPELALLTENEWFFAAKDARLAEEAQLRDTFRDLRGVARKLFARQLRSALSRYAADHGDELPTDPRQLAAFLEPQAPAELLRDYDLLQRGPLHSVPAGARILAERLSAARPHNNRVFVTTNKHGTEDLEAASPSP